MGIYSQIGEVHSHNIWLSMMTALGIVGLLVFIGIQTYVFASGIQLVRQKKHLAITLLAIQVVITVHGLFDFTLFLPQIGIMYYSTAAFISALAVENRDDSTAVRGVLNSFRFRI